MISVRPQRKNARNVVVTYACPKKHHSSSESGLVENKFFEKIVKIRRITLLMCMIKIHLPAFVVTYFKPECRQ